jgi:hypothetical protein
MRQMRRIPAYFCLEEMMANETTAALMEKLFHWKTELEVLGITFYMKVVTDAVVEDGRKFALLESRRMRRALRNPETDEYLMHLDAVTDLSDDDLKMGLINLASRDIARAWLNNNPRPVLEALGDHPTQEEQEVQEEAKETREEEYFNSLQDHLKLWQTDYEKVVKKQSREQLEGMYRKLRTDRVCEDLFSQRFEDYLLVHAIFTDPEFKQRAFTLDEIQELPTQVKTRFRDEYNTLSMSMDDIKN